MLKSRKSKSLPIKKKNISVTPSTVKVDQINLKILNWHLVKSMLLIRLARKGLLPKKLNMNIGSHEILENRSIS